MTDEKGALKARDDKIMSFPPSRAFAAAAKTLCHHEFRQARLNFLPICPAIMIVTGQGKAFVNQHEVSEGANYHEGHCHSNDDKCCGNGTNKWPY